MPEIKFNLPENTTMDDVIITIKVKDSDQVIDTKKVYKTSQSLRKAQKRYYQNNKERIRKRYRDKKKALEEEQKNKPSVILTKLLESNAHD